jgi:hypothetical protein
LSSHIAACDLNGRFADELLAESDLALPASVQTAQGDERVASVSLLLRSLPTTTLNVQGHVSVLRQNFCKAQTLRLQQESDKGDASGNIPHYNQRALLD